MVALLAEGVDRNTATLAANPYVLAASPSSRRAWIEIQLNYWNTYTAKSPSSRRAWIEIQ